MRLSSLHTPKASQGFKNKIIGGDFTTNPWQRGTSFTALANAAYGPDRFTANYSSAGVVDWLKTADAPTAAEAGVYATHCLHLDVTAADVSVDAADQYSILQNIEGLNAASFGFGQAGTRYVTLSFWVKSTKTGKFYCSLLNSVSNRAYVGGYTVNVSDTWERKVITIPVDTSGTWLYDTGIGIRLRWTLAAGTNFHTTADTWTAGNFRCASDQVNALDSAANNFKLALVQLEAGSTATDFETRPYGVELELCQRYYFDPANGGGTTAHFIGGFCGSASAYTTASIHLPTVMRATPTVVVRNQSYANCSTLTASGKSSSVIQTGLTQAAAGNGYCSFNLTASAEL